MAGNPAVANVGNVLTSQAIQFDSELIPNLKGQTNAFVVAAQRRVQKLNSGINRALFQYETLAASLGQATDGVVGNPEFVGQITTPAQVGEWNNFGNFSAMSVAAAIDEVVGNSAVEGGYQAGQTISELYSTTLDAASAVDSSVSQNSLLPISGSYKLDLATLRTMKNSMVQINVMPCKNDRYYCQMSPNVINDLLNATTVNDSIADFWKYTKEGNEKFEKVGGFTQLEPLDIGPGTGIIVYPTPFVTQTANAYSQGLIGFRTYVEGLYSHIGIWLEVPGDTDLGDGDWRTIDCGVVNDAPSSVYDPTATIGAWWYYRFHQTVVLPSNGGVSANTQRVRYIDSIPAIQ
jgi:hypothetical protein